MRACKNQWHRCLDIWKTVFEPDNNLRRNLSHIKRSVSDSATESVGSGVKFVTLERTLNALCGLLIVLLQDEIQGLPCCPDRVSGAACLDIHLSQLGETAPVLVLARCDGFLKLGNRAGQIVTRLEDKAQIESVLDPTWDLPQSPSATDRRPHLSRRSAPAIPCSGVSASPAPAFGSISPCRSGVPPLRR